MTKTTVMLMGEVSQIVRKEKEADRGSQQGRDFAKSEWKSSEPTTGTGSSTCPGIRHKGSVQWYGCWQQDKTQKRPAALVDSDSPIGEISSSATEASSGVCPPPFSSMAALGTSGLPEEASWCVRQVKARNAECI
jgi:hypothetical protein